MEHRKARWSFSDFAAPPLPRAAAVATDTEWAKMIEAHWPRVLRELASLAKSSPDIRERMRTHMFASHRTFPLDVAPGISLPATHVAHENGLTVMSNETAGPDVELRADVAALRAAFAMLVSGFHGYLRLGSADDWRDGKMRDFARLLVDPSQPAPLIEAAHDKIRDAVVKAAGR